VLKLSKKNNFYHDDLHTNLLRRPPHNEELLKRLNITYEQYCSYTQEYLKDAPQTFGFLMITPNKNGKNGICGFILGNYGKKCVHLHFILIDKGYRKLGYGNQLMEHFIGFIPSGVGIQIKTENNNLIKWYNKYGFEEDKRIDIMKKIMGEFNDDYIYLYRT
jgi:ribosomal protein S18 acetylase RimI-like enzyme